MTSISVTFPDGAARAYDAGTTPAQIAASIAPSLGKRTVLARVDGQLQDISRPLTGSAQLELLPITHEDVLPVLRHHMAHILAQAVQKLFPGTLITIGPPITDGFYYDFFRTGAFSLDDFARIETEMERIIDANYPITRAVWQRQAAIAHFRARGETFKVEIINDLPKDAELTVYTQGDWLDLCRGPHLPSTGAVPKAFRLTRLAGSYWRGDSTKSVLQRIYGTAWTRKAELDAHLERLAEAEKRDHRKLGRDMDLFHLQAESPGCIFWHGNGQVIWQAVESYIRRRLSAAGYSEVRTPILLDRALWERSGHWEKFRDNMFIAADFAPSLTDEDVAIPADAPLLAVKPMNCPAHVQIFRNKQRSWRDLPLRMSEFGCCHRNETRGSLHGLMRVRQMTQDDGHIFCTPEQITSETERFCALLGAVYADFGFAPPEVKLALRPDARVGSDAVWDKAERALEDAVKTTGLDWHVAPGEGAFYGPKLEFHLTDAIGRSWQCGTLQLDFVLPERLDALYANADGGKSHPVMLHRAILGSLERFIGILIEHYAGAMPLWLAPIQVMIATITSDADAYALEAADVLTRAGLRVDTELRNEKISYKVREHSARKVPIIAVVGRKEIEDRSLALRRLGSTELEIVDLQTAAADLARQSAAPDMDAARDVSGVAPQ